MSVVAAGIEAPPLGTRLAAGYVLDRFLGAGGMGAVYGAVAPDGRRVAVKLLLDKALRAGGSELVSRFKREANVTSTLDSPHIVPCLDAGVDEALAVPFMVMPLLAGLDLQSQVRKNGPLHPAIAARLFRQATVALRAAHTAGVIHRDIKPANIFLEHTQDGLVVARLLDFGIAKWTTHDTALTRTGSTLGSPQYMSPEQCENVKQADERSDLWSLGASLYEALCGQVPFADAKTLGNLFVAIMTSEVPPVQDFAPWVEPGLAMVLHGTLIRDKEARCPEAAELDAALKPFTYGSDVVTANMLDPLTPDVLGYRSERAAPALRWGPVEVEPEIDKALGITTPITDPLVGYQLADRYTLLRCLGRGGMGAVYEAEDEAGTRYAVKVIEPDSAGANEAGRRRFVREARAVMTIDSPHVVRVLQADADTAQQLPYIVMELLCGEDLGALIGRHGALDPSVVARLFVQACHGLSAAHAHDFVHRDIKPANLFLHHLPSGEVVVKVCDFGIVKRLHGADDDSTVALTRTGSVVGSPMWMSPEQSKNARDIDLRTDVWSLGVSLFQALSGTNPWAGRETVGELIVAICTEQLPHLQDRAPWIPADLAEVVHRTMSRDRRGRYQSTDELAQALAPFTGGADEVKLEQLKAVPEQRRSNVAARASGPELTSHGAASVVHTIGKAPRRSTAPTLAVGLIAVAVAAGGLFFGLREPPDPQAAPIAVVVSSAPALAAVAPTPIEVEVEVVPARAQVTVDGEPRELSNGRLALSGESGASFEVEVTEGERELIRNVVITRDGEAQPAILELPEQDAAIPPASPKLVSTRTRPPATATAKPAPSPTVPPPPPPTTTTAKPYNTAWRP